MLRTAPEDLKELHRKEELGMKFSIKLDKMQLVASKKQRPDHLPFGNLVEKIAKTMRNAPNRPVFKLKLEKDAFKTLFQLYFSSFKRIYHKISLEVRLGGQNERESARKVEKTHENEGKKTELLGNVKKNREIGEVIEEKEENLE